MSAEASARVVSVIDLHPIAVRSQPCEMLDHVFTGNIHADFAGRIG